MRYGRQAPPPTITGWSREGTPRLPGVTVIARRNAIGPGPLRARGPSSWPPITRRDAAAVGIPVLAFIVHAARYGAWIVDDAAITFAYARSIATGEGPVAQPGAPPAEGFSNPSWLALHVVGRLLGLFDRGTWFGVPDYIAFPKALAVACFAGCVIAILVVARSVCRRPAAVTLGAGLVLATIPSFVIWSVSGLENSLLALTAMSLTAVLLRAAATSDLLTTGTATTCGLLAATAGLTRPDGLVYSGAYPLIVLIVLRRHQLRAAVLSAGWYALALLVPLGSYLGWRYATFGELLPNTAIAKSQGPPSPRDVFRAAELARYPGWVLVAVATAVLLAALWRSPDRRLLLVPLLTLSLAVSAYVVLEPDEMGEYRFATAVWCLGVTLIAIAVDRVSVTGRAHIHVIAGALVVGMGLAAPAWWSASQTFRSNPTVPMCVVAAHGVNFNTYARLLKVRQGRLALPDVGATSLNSRLVLLDIAGLTDGRIAHALADGDKAGVRDYIFEEVRPEFIHVHGGWTSHVVAPGDDRLHRQYIELVSREELDADYVRRDLAKDPGDLEAARLYAAETSAANLNSAKAAPRAACGSRIRPSP